MSLGTPIYRLARDYARAAASTAAMELDFKQPHNSFITPTIQKGALILVTGVNGFVGSHVADQLIKSGYKVRGTVRSQDKAAWLYELFSSKYGNGHFEAFEVLDMVEDGAFDAAVQGVSGVVHVASVMSSSNNPEEVIIPTVKGAMNILTSASKEPSIKSVVYTSSSAAALTPKPNEKIVVTKDSWDEEALQTIKTNSNPTAFEVYAASKTEAEKAIWKAYETTKPQFQISTILPNVNFGPSLLPNNEPTSTSLWIKRLYDSDETIFSHAPPQYFVDVRDTARLHVAALIDPSCKVERLFAFAEPFNFNDVLGILREVRPEKGWMGDREGLVVDRSDVPNHRAERLLRKYHGKGWTKLRESVKETIEGWEEGKGAAENEHRKGSEGKMEKQDEANESDEEGEQGEAKES